VTEGAAVLVSPSCESAAEGIAQHSPLETRSNTLLPYIPHTRPLAHTTHTGASLLGSKARAAQTDGREVAEREVAERERRQRE
jgi:hypothetical protein